MIVYWPTNPDPTHSRVIDVDIWEQWLTENAGPAGPTTWMENTFEHAFDIMDDTIATAFVLKFGK